MAARNWKVRRLSNRSTPHAGAGGAARHDERGAEGRNGHEGAGVDTGAGQRHTETTIAPKPTQVATAAQVFGMR